MIRTEEDHLAHYGILRRSGRYPWGSGGTQTARNRSYLQTIADLKEKGMSETEIARGFGITTTQLREARTVARAEQKESQRLAVQRLADKGWSNVAIGQRMGLNESSVRALRAPGEKDKVTATRSTANMLKKEVDQKKYIDVGKGVEAHVDVTRSRLDNAIALLKDEGYKIFNIKIPQVGIPGQFTVTKVLAHPDATFGEVSRNRTQIQQISNYSTDHGRSFFGIQPPIAINPNRLQVNYAEDGGAALDGVIFVRPGVKDLHMGADRYGQVRIQIGDGHYIKGMAVYRDGLPKGADLVFNTNKSNTGRKTDALKPLEADPELPFGSLVRQMHDPETGKVNSAMNIVGLKEGQYVEGGWDKWSRTLSSQMLSKQDPELARQQLNLTYERRLNEYDEINSLTNATVRKDLLMKFADQTDAASVHLKAANLPRQATKVLLPVPSMKETEVYAPGLKNGERVVLVRFPHGGTFEIPELKVNNRNPEAKKLIGGTEKLSTDAIGINHKVAQHLSGADFDGDTVLVIPNRNRAVKSTPALQELKDFDPMTYRIPKDSGIKPVSNRTKQLEMGKVSNLITDMTVKGAPAEDIARAVKHSMVVIDAEKHQLNWKQSEKDQGILQLKEEYQGDKKAGAQSIISKRKGIERIPERVPRPPRLGGPIDPKTGKKVYVTTGRTYIDKKTGLPAEAKTKIERLALADNAYNVVSRSPAPMEILYADHSNRLKALANQARKTAVAIKPPAQSKSAKKVYAPQVESLNAKLNTAKRNAPLERQAQLLANAQVTQKRQANPHMEDAEVTKIRQYALNEARNRTGAQKTKISITQEEWNAIQAGAISHTKLQDILTNADLDTVRHLALPQKQQLLMTSAKQQRAQSMLSAGYTQADVAEALGVSLSTLKVSLSG